MPSVDTFMRRVKWIFTATMVSIFTLFIVSAVALDDTVYANENFLVAQVQAGWYRLKYSFISAPNVLAGVDNVFNTTATYSQSDSRAYAIPVLNYHGILRSWDGSESNMSQARFEEHLFALKENGYHPVTLSDLYRFLRGEKTLSDRSVVITFDDGRRDTLYGAGPILQAINFKAAMFIVTKVSSGDSGGSYYMSEEEIQKAAESGAWEFGAHAHEGHADSFPLDSAGGKGNFYSNKLWIAAENRLETDREYIDRTASDLIRAKQLLEQILDQPVHYFAFPFGEFGQVESNAPDLMPRMIAIAHSMYDLLFYQHAPGVYFRQAYADPGTEDTSFLVRRISVRGDWTADRLLSVLEASNAKPLPYLDTLKTDRGWLSSWGTYRILPEGGLALVAAPNAAGASAILDGTGHWQNYTITARVESPTQTGAFVWVRFKDDANNAACNFGEAFAHVEQTVNGEHRVINGIRGSDFIPTGPFTIEARVEGRHVTCLIDGSVVAESEFLDPTLTRGGIGFKKWNATIGESSLTIRQIEVNAFEPNNEAIPAGL